MKRFDVWLANLDPTQGAEMRKTRPCVVLSPEVMNARLLTLLMAPLTRGGFRALFRVPCELKGQAGQVALDQMRCLDKERLVRRVGRLQPAEVAAVLRALAELFGA
jgi:mRNA interferase MazF